MLGVDFDCALWRRTRYAHECLLASNAAAGVMLRAYLAWFAAAFALTFVLQMQGGAYTADFAGNPDEPAHYVTGVMFRDYVTTIPWTSPVAFAHAFYDRYPMVAIGHWPPVFYVVQSLWTIPAGVSPPSVMLLMAVLTAAAAMTIFAFWRARFGSVGAGALAVAFVCVPIVQIYSRMLMAEMLMAFFMASAAYAYRVYIDAPHWRPSVAFALVASAAILTKANGLALGMLPPLAIVFARRLELTRRGDFWLPAAIVAVICAPWYALTFDLAREGWSASYDPSWLIRQPAAVNASYLLHIIGVPLFALALAGFVVALAPRRGRGAAPDSAVMGALLLSIWLFNTFVVPVRDMRHFIPAVPALIGFAGIAVGAALPAVSRTAVALLGIAAALGFSLFAHSPRKPSMGADVAAAQVLSHTAHSETVLVSSARHGEGVFIAALVAQERQPGRRIVRAGKVLSDSSWNGSNYRLLHETTDHAGQYLRAAGIRTIAIDLGASSSNSVPHHRQLLEIVSDSRRWRRVDSTGISAFRVFQAVQ